MVICFAAIWIALACAAVAAVVDVHRLDRQSKVDVAREREYQALRQRNRVRALEVSLVQLDLKIAYLHIPDFPPDPADPPDPNDRGRVRRGETPVWEPTEIIYHGHNRHTRGAWVGDRSGEQWKEQQ